MTGARSPEETPAPMFAPARWLVCAGFLLLGLCPGGVARAQTFLIDTGPLLIGGVPATTPSPDSGGNTWNNFSPGQFIRLRDTAGTLTGAGSGVGIGFGATTPVGQSLAAGEGQPHPDPGGLGPLAVASATQDYIFRFNEGGTTLGLELSNLVPGQAYSFRFFASRASGEPGAQTRYSVTGANGTQSAILATTGNAASVALVPGVDAAANGTIQIVLTPAQGAFMFLNAFEIAVGDFSAPTVVFGAQPGNLLVDEGGVLSFSASVEASEPGLQLRWAKDGVALNDGARIAGAHTASLTITGASFADVGEYTLVATLGQIMEVSNPAVGGVRAAPGGALDLDASGTLDFFDVLGLLNAFDAASP